MTLVLYFLAYQTAFILGFIVGRMGWMAKQQQPIVVKNIMESAGISGPVTVNSGMNNVESVQVRKTEESSAIPTVKKVVKIDDSTFVTAVKADVLERKGATLGKESSVADNIGTSISKLAQLKKNS
jgi:hypothetical protein